MNRFVIPHGDATYTEAIARELYFWSHRRVMSDKERVSYPASHPLVARYLNGLISGDPERDWLDFFASTFRPAGRAASLGSGIGFYERRLLDRSPIDTIDLYELCPANLDRAKSRLDIPGRQVRYIDVDLNFARLPADTYDLVLSRFFLHHIVNLEHLLDQVNRSLKPDGVFVLYDYVGESRYLWPESKKSFINGLLAELAPLGVVGFPLGGHPGDDLYAPDHPDHRRTLIQNSPFETIRSQDIPTVVDAVFGDSKRFEVRFGALIQAAFRTLDYSSWDSPGLRRALEIFVDLDHAMSARAVFRPCGIFGVYGKSTHDLPECERWSDEKVRSELVP